MKHVKPGRGPSKLTVFFSAVGALAMFITAISTLCSGFGEISIVPFLFSIAATVNAVYHFRNAKRGNRYSVFDVTDAAEEPDPLNERFSKHPPRGEAGFCPYCGAAFGKEFLYCCRCGRKIE